MNKALKVLLIAASCCLAAHADPFIHETPTGRAGEVSQIEGRLARLALEKSHDPAVRKHAQETVAESDALFHKLAILAEERNVPMATGPTAAQEAEFEALAAMPESSFDTAYFQKQNLALKTLNQLCVQDTTDPALKTILADYVEMEAAGR